MGNKLESGRWEDRGWRCRVVFGYDGDGRRLWQREFLPRPLGVVYLSPQRKALTLYAGYGFEEGYVEELVPHEAGEVVLPGDVCGKVVGVTVLGRFISPDSIVPDPSNPQSFNRYSYVYNNPIIRRKVRSI